MGFTVCEIQQTPNPNALKFIVDQSISDTPVSFLTPGQGAAHPLASQLFAIEGVTSLLLLGNFVTVNKRPSAKWGLITKRVREILEEY